MTGLRWTVLIPIKPLDVAKSRLRGALAGVEHRRLVLAMAADTVRAALGSPAVDRVLVVTNDRTARAVLGRIGAEAVPDAPRTGINPALAYAATVVRATATGALGLAALTGDLPALRSHELTAALRAAAASATPAVAGRQSGRRLRGYVPDAAGTGTVLLAAASGTFLEPCFGVDSARAHAAGGAVRLTGDWPGLRRDVDTAEDLVEAARLGLGRCTAETTGRTAALPA